MVYKITFITLYFTLFLIGKQGNFIPNDLTLYYTLQNVLIRNEQSTMTTS